LELFPVEIFRGWVFTQPRPLADIRDFPRYHGIETNIHNQCWWPGFYVFPISAAWYASYAGHKNDLTR